MSGTADQHGVHATIYYTSTDNDERHRRPARRTRNDNNNNNKHDNVYGAVIMAEPLREFTRFI